MRLRKLQERWFAGQENYSQSPSLLRNEIDQNGLRYSPAMINSTTIRMDWVLSFPRAEKAFDNLVENQIRTAGAIKALKDKLAPYRNRHDIVAWNLAKSDFLVFHQQFQFQRISVNANWSERISEYLERASNGGGVPDDLTATLGSFNFYAAVRYAYFELAGKVAVVTDIVIYVRDPYEFSDDQYLGHWSPSHVAVVPAHQVGGGSGWLNYPVVEGSAYEKDNTLYPVTNKHYRDWRQKNSQGGDFMIYTDRLSVKLRVPIRVVL